MINNIVIEKLIEGLNEEQRQAVKNPIDTCTQIVAGAGTGKTKVISKRYVKLVNDLIQQGVEKPLEHLLVITFTEKAAGEMKERILNELKENNIKHFGQEMWVSTIHSFCSKILRTHSIEANLSPSFKLGDEAELLEIYDNLIKKITYNEYNTIDGIDKIAESLGLNSSILNAESLNKLNKINELNEIFADILPIIKKVKALGKTPLEFMEKSINSINNFTDALKNLPLNCETKLELITSWENCLKDYIYEGCQFCEISQNDKGKISYNGNYEKIMEVAFSSKRKKSPKEWELRDGVFDNLDEINSVEILVTQIIALVYALYQNELEKRDLADFDDLINKTLYILKNNSDIKNYYQNYFKQLIVDEFQDTNGAQLRLLFELLPQEAPNITFVGDVKQSIYGFRYAQMENLNFLHKAIEKKYNKTYKPIKLKYNYRSTPQILEAVNHVTLEELNINEALTANPNIDFPKDKDAVKVPTIYGYNYTNDYKVLEAKYIASEIIEVKKEKGLNYKDFAVLVKSHGAADVLEKELMKYGIPAVKKANNSYFDKTVIKNLRSLLKLANDMRDDKSLIRVLSVKLSQRDIFELKVEVDKNFSNEDRKTLKINEKILKLIESDTFKTIEIKEESKNYIIHIFDILFNIVENKKHSSLLQIYYKLVKEITPYYNLQATEKMLADIDLAIFEKIIIDFIQTEKYVTLKTFNEYIDKIKEDKNYELPSVSGSNVDAVQLLTIHASKGLEFPYVFVANITNRQVSEKGILLFDLKQGSENNSFGVFINAYKGAKTLKRAIYSATWNSYKEKSEQCRLFYVAVSRAKKYLNVIQGINSADFIKRMPCPSTINIDADEINIEKQPLEYKFLKLQANRLPENLKPNIRKEEKTYNMSFSKLNTFSHCKNKFLLKYKYHYPEIIQDTKESYFVGSVIHNLIYNSFLNKKSFNVDEIENMLKDIEIDVDSKKEIILIYKNFSNSNFAPEKISNYLTEYGFKYHYKNIDFSGDIDLIVKNADGSVIIVDFKTNKNIEKSLNEYAKQVYIYKTALSEIGFNVKNTILLNLKPDESKEIIISESDLKAAKEEIEKEISEITNYEETGVLKQQYNHNCKKCGYNYICNK